MLSSRKPLLSLLLACLPVLPCAAFAHDSSVHMNQLQVIGTHNSYHVGFGPSAGKLVKAKAPQVFAGLNYVHPPLTDQLNAGVRQVELDVYADSKGGLYAHPAITAQIAKAGLPADAPMAPPGVMEKLGFKVMHVQDIDQRSTCQPFTACLTEIRAWLDAHPHHVPLFILVETKQSPLHLDFPTARPEPFTPAVLDALDQAITSVIPRSDLVTPDDVRGSHATLDAAVRANGWPSLAKARGKVVFLLDQKDVTAPYLKGHPALRGRVLFTNAKPGSSDAAFVECNACDADKIDALVHRGYLVRTRLDEPGKAIAPRRLAAMLASSAQILSTDHPKGEAAADGYVAELPNHEPVRCHPILKQENCSEQLKP